MNETPKPTAPAVQATPTPITVKALAKPKKNHFVRNFTLSLILILILALTGLSLLLIYPTNGLSKFVIGNTALKNVIKTDESQSSQNSNSDSSSSSSSSNSSDNKSENSSKGNSNSNSSKNNSNSNSSGNNNNQNNNNFVFNTGGTAKNTISIIEDNLPSVLSIRVYNETDNRGFATETAGTGYIVSEDGLVVTNKHVIAAKCKSSSPQIQISGLSFDRKDYKMDLLTVDPIDDIAILKIQNPTGKLNPVKFTDSSKIKLGTEVLAIGNVLGQLQNTVTRGIISGMDRSLKTDLIDECTGQPVRPDGLIQTDAAINKGNSGGPLFDNFGNLVGMNTFGTTEAQSVGLAITSNTVMSALNSFKQNQKIIRPRLGVSTEPLYPGRKQQYTWLPLDYGEIIYAEKGDPVSPDSPASKVGLKEGDIILEVNGQKIIYTNDNALPLRKAILSNSADQEIELTVLKVSGNDGNGFNYEQNPVKLKVKLGGISFEMPKSSLFAR